MKINRRYLTLRGCMLFAIAFVIMFAAMNYQRNALFWLAYSVFVMLGLGVGASVFGFKKLQWEWDVPTWTFANASLAVNGGWRKEGPAPGIVVTSMNASSLPYVLSDLTPGKCTLTTVTCVSEYPIGLVKTAITLPPPPTVWVYPAPINHQNRAHATRLINAEPGNLRVYHPGDTPNRILKKTQSLPESHWRTRAFEDIGANATPTQLSWHALPASWSSQLRAEQLSYEISIMPADRPFTLVLPDGTIHKGSGTAHQHHCWQLLALEMSPEL